MQTIHVLIVDDHPLIQEGLGKILALEPGIEVVAVASDGEEAIKAANSYQPDVILMDINMPKLNGIEATRVIRQQVPTAGVIALTIHDDEHYVIQLMKAGVSGYLFKDVAASELVAAIKAVARGEMVMHPSITRKVINELRRTGQGELESRECLTGRELEVLTHIARGESNKIIAGCLCISEKTVKNHTSSIFRKLGVADRTQAALMAVKNRLVEI